MNGLQQQWAATYEVVGTWQDFIVDVVPTTLGIIVLDGPQRNNRKGGSGIASDHPHLHLGQQRLEVLVEARLAVVI